MNRVEEELLIIGNQIDEAKNVQEVGKLYFEMKNKCENLKKDELTEKARKLSVGNLVFVIYKLREFYDEWGKSGELPSDTKELNVAERIIKEIFKIIDKIGKADFPPYFSENHRSEAKKGLIDFRIKINEEKFLRQNY